MPTNKPPKQISVWITTAVPNPEDYETINRFKRYAVGHKNYLKALQSLLDHVNAL